MYKFIMSFSFLLLNTFCLQAQSVELLNFVTKTHDFGPILDNSGIQSYEFSFLNNSEDTLKIGNVASDCGCTATQWTRRPIAPQESATVTVDYNPLNQTGLFSKGITIYFDKLEPIILAIRGQVIPSDLLPEDVYKYRNGQIGFQSSIINLGRFTNEEVVSTEVALYNFSANSIPLTQDFISPEHIQLSFKDSLLLAGETTVLQLTYDPMLKQDLGFFNEAIKVFLDSTAIKLNVYATINNYFSPMTKEAWDQAAKIMVEKDYYDLGTISENDSISMTIKLRNEGASQLQITKLLPNCSCMSYKLKENKIEAGMETELELLIIARNRKGPMTNIITIFSNDPSKPEMNLSIKSFVKAKNE